MLYVFWRHVSRREHLLDQRQNQFAPKWLRRASWLALVSLAWMQLAFAGHQFEHSLTYADPCEVCVQLDRLDDVVSGEPPADEALAADCSAAIHEPAINVEIAVVRDFNPRAPPTI